jgi:hypothetical protein
MFSRIKSAGWGILEKLTSTQITNLDIDHAKAVDKTGDNVADGGGISGEIDVLSGAQIKALAGAKITIDVGSLLEFIAGSQASGSIVFTPTSTPEITQATTTASATTLTVAAQSTSLAGDQGGGLNLNAGSCSGASGRGGVVVIAAGGGSALNGNVTITTPASSVQISDAALNLEVNSELVAQSNGAELSLFPVGGTGQAFQVNAWSGTPSSFGTQRRSNYVENYVVNPAGVVVPVGPGITLANASAAVIEVSWIARDSGAFNYFAGNKFLIIAHCSPSGVTNSTALITGSNFVAPNGNYADSSLWFALSYPGNTLQLSVVAAPPGVTFAVEMQVVVSVSYC